MHEHDARKRARADRERERAGEHERLLTDGLFFGAENAASQDRGDHVWSLRVLAQRGEMRLDGAEFPRAGTHRGWGIARWARFS